jgi:hypothetical protein
MKQEKKKLVWLALALLTAGIPPILFPIAQAGIAQLSSLAIYYLIPSAAIIFIVIFITSVLNYNDLKRQVLNGILAGLAATVGLEIIRETGFRLGGMPGDMPKLMGVLLLDRFALGPNIWSNLAGWTYHFWNGAAFGIIFSLIFSKSNTIWGVLFAIIIGIGFMASPVPRSLGIGLFGLQFKNGYQFMLTVILAHIAFGSILGWSINKLNQGLPGIVSRLKNAFSI